MNFSNNVLLKPHSTFRVGGHAAHFAVVKTVKELARSLSYADQHNLTTQVLAGGSNILFSDAFFDGLVIKIKLAGIYFKERGSDVFATVGAGEILDTFIKHSIEKGYQGIENLSGIPGTVGATPIQNVGAYGVEVSDSIRWVEVFDRASKQLTQYTNSDCNFSYRDSRFKQSSRSDDIITRVCFRLHKEGKLVLRYEGVKEKMQERGILEPALADVRNAILSLRKDKFPDLKEYGTAGSFFKNPIVTEDKARLLLQRYPGLPHFPVSGGKIKLSLAWILDHICGLKGYRRGSVGAFNKQPLVIVNYGDATQKEIIMFSNEIKNSVKKLTGIIIIPEVTIL